MIPRRLEHFVWLASLVLTGIAIVEMRRQLIVLESPSLRQVKPPPGGTVRTVSLSDGQEQYSRVLAGDLFQRERRAPERTTIHLEGTPQAAAPAKPRLVLVGIIGGPPWTAIVDGLPGHDGGYVVSAGESIEGLTVRSVRRDGATVSGMDTIWTLRVRGAP